MRPQLIAVCVWGLVGLSLTGCELPPGVAVYQPAEVDRPPANPGQPEAPRVEGCQPALELTLGAPVAELRSTTPLPIEIHWSDAGRAPGPRPLELVLLRDGEVVKTLLQSADASSASSMAVPFLAEEIAGIRPGLYSLRATMGCPEGVSPSAPASAQAELFVARLGATRIDVQGGDGARLPLMFHAVGGRTGNFYPLTASDPATSLAAPMGEAELEGPDGIPRSFPMPWSGLDSPPLDTRGAVLKAGVALPVSLKVGTRPDWVFSLAKSDTGVGTPSPSLPAIRLVLEGGEIGDGVVTEGGKITVRSSTTPVPSVGRYDVLVGWRFEAQDGAGTWRAIPGAIQSAPVRLYGVLGNELGASPPHLPWVAVVDEVTRHLAGRTTDPAEIRAALVKYVFEESGLRYDRSKGASAYTNYPNFPNDYAGGRFELSAFLARSNGTVINCADAASILSTFASMVGVRLRYAILLEDFPLNPLISLGGSTPGAPFDNGNMGFKFHAVTSHDSAATINDATLAVDGDSDPRRTPFARRLVQNMAGAEYLQRLSPGNPEYRYVDQSTTLR